MDDQSSSSSVVKFALAGIQLRHFRNGLQGLGKIGEPAALHLIVARHAPPCARLLVQYERSESGAILRYRVRRC